MPIKYFESLESTNQYCELLDLNQIEEFTIICAREQTAGIGQRGNHWESEAGKNLTFSLILHPSFLDVSDQFKLTKILSLALCDYVEGQLNNALLNDKVHIKWPNDIYVNDKKIGGILSTLRISGTKIQSAICGIGLNINQTSFSDWIPNPISLAQLTHSTHPIESCLEVLQETLQSRYNQLQEITIGIHQDTIIDTQYLDRLYQLHEESSYVYKGNPISATIKGVDHFGHLQLLTSDKTNISCDLKELQYCI